MAVRVVVFNVRHGHRIDAPGVGDKDLTIDPELFVEPLLIILRLLSDVTHGEEVGPFQCVSFPWPQHPEVRQRTVIP